SCSRVFLRWGGASESGSQQSNAKPPGALGGLVKVVEARTEPLAVLKDPALPVSRHEAHAEHRQILEPIAVGPVKQLIEAPVLLFVWQQRQRRQAELLCASPAITDAAHSKLLWCDHHLPAFPTGYVTRIDHGCDLSMKKISECMPKQAMRELFRAGTRVLRPRPAEKS